MTLIEELQQDVVDAKVSLSTVLRKAKVLASMLGDADFKNWVDAELNGYRNAADVPVYRRFSTPSFGILSGSFGRMVKNAPIPTSQLPDVVKHLVTAHAFRESAKGLEALAHSSSETLTIRWPAEAVAISQEWVAEDFALVDAWRVLNRAQVEEALDAIRNRLLEFILKLKELKPEILASDTALRDLSKESVQNVFNTTIIGDHNVLASGSGFSQSVQQDIRPGDLNSILGYMRRLAVSEEDLRELETALKDDGTRPEKSLGQRVQGWIGKMTAKAVQGVWKIAVQTAPGLITKALSAYYGWK